MFSTFLAFVAFAVTSFLIFVVAVEWLKENDTFKHMRTHRIVAVFVIWVVCGIYLFG